MASPAARAWWIHGLVLAGASLVYLIVTWEAWFPPPNRGWNLDGLGAVQEFLAEELTEDAGAWSWRATVWVAAPQERELCFVSANAPGRARCGPMPRPHP